ncbi:unnamed protein product [Toxocara canis]|uniref:Metalloendopeptidase n=1 Tax=Toxocara canis TaxID=6265 RepID=A0A183UFW7_TOXCA|nr:unnamed protein product [Toxocara canis]
MKPFVGKFQGDIDGIDENFLKQSADVLYSALRNKQLLWPNGVVLYELDPAFSNIEVCQDFAAADEVAVLKGAFSEYRRHTCVHFEKRQNQRDYLYITKGLGLDTIPVGKTGGRQEISLGRGCLFHEIVVHELMHAVGFWHEHSRADRDEHIHVRWDNILPGMQSQFDKISGALQDLQGENYDYRSIMHYDSTAFSRNGQNTMEAVDKRFTTVIGSALKLSVIDIKKVIIQVSCRKLAEFLYKCQARKKKILRVTATTPSTQNTETPQLCEDEFADCAYFEEYCRRASFAHIMNLHCPFTCNQCSQFK